MIFKYVIFKTVHVKTQNYCGEINWRKHFMADGNHVQINGETIDLSSGILF